MTTNYHFHGNIATSANIVLHSLIECAERAEGTYLPYDLNAQQNKRNMVSGWCCYDTWYLSVSATYIIFPTM